MKKTFSKLLAPCLMLCFATSGSAQSLSDALDGIRTISYSEDSIFDLGDTLSASDPSRFLNRCIEYDSETDVKFDTQGSTSSSISVRFIGSSSDLETELKYSFSAHATSKVTIADLGGG